MIQIKSSESSKVKQGKIYDQKQIPREEQKIADNRIHSQNEKVLLNNASTKPINDSQKRIYKNEVKSINKIISDESKILTHQKQPNIVKSKTIPAKVPDEPKVNQVHQNDDSLSLELSHIQNQDYVGRPMKEHIVADHASPTFNNSNVEPIQNQANVQNQIENGDNSQIDFDKIKDENYSQLWK